MPGKRRTASLARSATAEQRFWSKVDRRGADECWPWRASVGTHGYGAFWDGARVTTAPRFVFVVVVRREMPEGWTVDHTCRNRLCCNPGHMEAVTRGENVMRGESPVARGARAAHCPAGHRRTLENLYVSPKGHRQCRRCMKRRNRDRRRS